MASVDGTLAQGSRLKCPYVAIMEDEGHAGPALFIFLRDV
ncbi:hypothetical protein SAMN04488011_11340 [Palleronia pelagia]|uniref:Uncharacterized protein n=1 Tax=Palleronia pelagia TaxID=387096 RepID=A0A1H8M554_9RHOB|nr:hypothetical protein SAMN04488011_11340 [Palleronia pelagia]